MEVIQKYLEYTSQPEHALHPNIRHSAELRLAQNYSKTVDELQKLRLAVLGDATISKDGTVKVTSTPGTAVLRQRIDELDAKLARLVEISNEMADIFERVGVESIHDLQELRARHQNTINSHPFQAWDLFVQTRGKGGVGANMRTGWLPSDLCQVPAYKEQEDRLRAEMEEARAALIPLDEASKRLSELAKEGRGP
jgi:sugar phosphate isomerase/epimerase